jgi:hypothetical protein
MKIIYHGACLTLPDNHPARYFGNVSPGCTKKKLPALRATRYPLRDTQGFILIFGLIIL